MIAILGIVTGVLLVVQTIRKQEVENDLDEALIKIKKLEQQLDAVNRSQRGIPWTLEERVRKEFAFKSDYKAGL